MLITPNWPLKRDYFVEPGEVFLLSAPPGVVTGLLAPIWRKRGRTVSQALLDEKVSPSSSTSHILGLAIAQIITVMLPSFWMLHLATTRKRDGYCIVVKNFNLDWFWHAQLEIWQVCLCIPSKDDSFSLFCPFVCHAGLISTSTVILTVINHALLSSKYILPQICILPCFHKYVTHNQYSQM